MKTVYSLFITCMSRISMALLLGFFIASPLYAQIEAPKLFLDYGYVPFDRACESLKDKKIDEALVKEMSERAEEFQQHWDSYGVPLLQDIVNEIGKPFKYRDLVATMSVCEFYSMSHPLIVNMRRFLKAGPRETPHPKHMFISLVLHELLHIYIHGIGTSDLPLGKKYQDEPFSVQSHIYLMAVLKMVLLKNGMEAEFQAILDFDRELNRPIYLRSWEIVHELEDYRQFVEELKSK